MPIPESAGPLSFFSSYAPPFQQQLQQHAHAQTHDSGSAAQQQFAPQSYPPQRVHRRHYSSQSGLPLSVQNSGGVLLVQSPSGRHFLAASPAIFTVASPAHKLTPPPLDERVESVSFQAPAPAISATAALVNTPLLFHIPSSKS